MNYKSKTPKYKNHVVTVDGIKFDSMKEANRYRELKLLEKAGKITGLQRQVKYILIPSQFGRVPDASRPGGTKRVCLEREVSYYADFVYKDAYGNLVVEDVKGYRDPASAAYAKFVIKRKLMLERYGIRINEI